VLGGGAEATTVPEATAALVAGGSDRGGPLHANRQSVVMIAKWSRITGNRDYYSCPWLPSNRTFYDIL
jgi:hypothetical protein